METIQLISLAAFIVVLVTVIFATMHSGRRNKELINRQYNLAKSAQRNSNEQYRKRYGIADTSTRRRTRY